MIILIDEDTTLDARSLSRGLGTLSNVRHVPRVSRARAKLASFRSFFFETLRDFSIRWLYLEIKEGKGKKILGVFPAIAVNNQGR